MGDYGIYLSVNDGEQGFRLPVNPQKIEIKEQGKGNTYRIIALGEINSIQAPSLTEVRFESFFPAQRYPFVVGGELLPPASYVDMITAWMREKQVARLIMTNAAVDINMLVSIENFTWREVAGAVGDIEYELTLKRYVHYAPKLVTVKIQTMENATKAVMQNAQTRPQTKAQPKIHVLQKGETLWALAQKYLGNGNRWREIAALNGIKDSQVRSLPVGMQIKIPTA